MDDAAFVFPRVLIIPGNDLHVPVPHQPDKPIDRFFTFDNHPTSYFWVDIHLTFVRAGIIPSFPRWNQGVKTIFLHIHPRARDRTRIGFVIFFNLHQLLSLAATGHVPPTRTVPKSWEPRAVVMCQTGTNISPEDTTDPQR
jgi:hypothetical protein